MMQIIIVVGSFSSLTVLIGASVLFPYPSNLISVYFSYLIQTDCVCFCVDDHKPVRRCGSDGGFLNTCTQLHSCQQAWQGGKCYDGGIKRQWNDI